MLLSGRAFSNVWWMLLQCVLQSIAGTNMSMSVCQILLLPGIVNMEGSGDVWLTHARCLYESSWVRVLALLF